MSCLLQIGYEKLFIKNKEDALKLTAILSEAIFCEEAFWDDKTVFFPQNQWGEISLIFLSPNHFFQSDPTKNNR